MKAAPFAVRSVMPYVHVADVDRAIEFYRLLGFEVTHRYTFDGRPGAAAVQSGAGNMLIAPASAPIDAAAQAVLFYMHSHDVAALRRHLLASGVAVSEVAFPDYMPNGEISVVDPDGYCVLIGQP